MFISYLPDEMDVGFEQSLEIGAKLGLTCVEMRSVDGKNVIDLNDDEVERAKKLLDQYEMTVSALATPFLKCTMPGLTANSGGPMHQAREMSYEEHLGLIKRGTEIAKFFDTNLMRLFSFWQVDGVDYWDALNKAVSECLDLVEGTGVGLSLENEGACFIGTTEHLAEAALRLNDPRLTFIYDPGNSARTGMAPRARDFAIFGDRIGLVHIKDGSYDRDTGESAGTLIGEGEVGYVSELKRIATKYDGPLTLEPHYAPGGDTVQGMRDSVAALRSLAEQAGIKLDASCGNLA